MVGFFRVLRKFAYSNTIQGQLKPEKMITARIKLDETVNKGFQELLDHRDQHCKILINAQMS